MTTFHINGIPFSDAKEAFKLQKACGGGWSTIVISNMFLVVEPTEFLRVAELGIKFDLLVENSETQELALLPMNEDSRLSARFVQYDE